MFIRVRDFFSWTPKKRSVPKHPMEDVNDIEIGFYGENDSAFLIQVVIKGSAGLDISFLLAFHWALQMMEISINSQMVESIPRKEREISAHTLHTFRGCDK